MKLMRLIWLGHIERMDDIKQTKIVDTKRWNRRGQYADQDKDGEIALKRFKGIGNY
jgi:hypothetical protein